MEVKGAVFKRTDLERTVWRDHRVSDRGYAIEFARYHEHP